MRIIGQDIDGRLIIDLEGESYILAKSIPGQSPAFICNGRFLDQQDGNASRLEIIDKNNLSIKITKGTIDPIGNRFEILDL